MDRNFKEEYISNMTKIDILVEDHQRLLRDIDKKLDLHVNEFCLHKTLEEKQLEALSMAIVGDGTSTNPGLNIRLDRLEQNEKNRRSHLTYIYTSLVLIGSGLLLSFLKIFFNITL